MYKEILNALIEPIVMVDTKHEIVFINDTACARFKKSGGRALVGKSLFDCHNANSKEVILEIFERMQSGLDEKLISDNEKQKVYMRAVRDENGILIGYYERYEPKK